MQCSIVVAYRFGEFRLDEQTWSLERDGERVPLEPKLLQLLLFMIERRDRVVTKDELLDALWPDQVASEASLLRAMSLARRALGDSARAQRWIRTKARVGYRFVGEVAQETEAEARSPRPLGERPAGDATPEPFVGRESLMASLAKAWETVAGGHGNAVVLTGEPGIGKTRAAFELAESVRRAGGRVAVAWCSEQPDAPPYWPWIQLLRELREGDAEEADALLGLLAPSGEPSLGSAFAAVADRFQLLDRLVAFVSRQASEAPTLLLVDDLQWADRSSRKGLEFLTRTLAHTRLLVLATCREDAASDPSLGETVGMLVRGPGCQAIPLAGLSEADVADYLRAIGSDESDAPALTQRTRGNPLFVRELARFPAAADEGVRDALPPSLRGVLQQRLSALPAPLHELLTWVAVAGRGVGLPVLSRVTSQEPGDVADALAQAGRLGLLETSSDNRIRFSHELVREALLAELPAGDQARHHLELAEQLERIAGDTAADEVAHHYERALQGGVVSTQSVGALVRAAARAGRGLAYDEAAHLYEQALLAQRMGEGGDARAELGILLAMGPMQWGMNQFATALDLAERAADLARSLDDPEALALAALLMWPMPPNGNPTGRALLEEAEAKLPKPSALRGQVLARLAYHLYLEDEDPRRLLPLCREALELVRPEDDSAGLGWVLFSFLVSCWSVMPIEERRALVAEAHALGKIRGGSDRIPASQLTLTQLLEDGRIDEVDAEIAAVERHIESQASQTFFRWYTPLYRGMRALMRGDLPEAEGWIQQTLEAGRDTPMLDEGSAFGAQLFQLRVDQGRVAELEPLVRMQAERGPRSTTFLPLHAYLLCECDRVDEARTIYERFADSYDPAVDANRAIALTVLATVCARVGDRERAGRFREALLPFQDRVTVNLTAWICQGSPHWPLGLLAEVDGDREAAIDHLERAIEANRRLEMRVYLTRARLDLARLLAKGNDHDRRRGHDLVDACADVARRYGYAALEKQADALRGSLRTP